MTMHCVGVGAIARTGFVRTGRNGAVLQSLPARSRLTLARMARSARARDDSDDETPPESSKTSQEQGAVAISRLGRTAGEVFVLAGFLKILIVCFPFSTMAISMYFQGLCDLGYWAAIKMMPLAIGILALAKVTVDRKLHERRWAPLLITVGGILALVLSRWAFARPRPSPLDPMLAQYHRSRAQEAAAAQRRAEFQAAPRKSLEPDSQVADRATKLQNSRQGRFS